MEPEEGVTPTCCLTTGTRIKGDEKLRDLVMNHLGTATTDSSHERISRTATPWNDAGEESTSSRQELVPD
jgi:hypothetical protein